MLLYITNFKYSPRGMAGQPPQPLATIFRNQLGSKKMERTSSYSSDHSDRSSSSGPPMHQPGGGLPTPPPHSPSGSYRMSFPPPGRVPPPPNVPSGYYPPPSPKMDPLGNPPIPPMAPPPAPVSTSSSISEKVLEISADVAQSTRSEPNYMELSHANPYSKTQKTSLLKSSPAISIHTDISRDSGFASSQDHAEFESHYRQLNEYNEVLIIVFITKNKYWGGIFHHLPSILCTTHAHLTVPNSSTWNGFRAVLKVILEYRADTDIFKWRQL